MKTCHQILFTDARKMSQIDDDSVNLVVTSPPYPMIEMWDDLFSAFSDPIAQNLKKKEGNTAFELMHRELDKVWAEAERVVKPSGFVCINIGDATRKIGSDFQLYSNHSRITTAMVSLGFQPLPIILWKKPTNSPNKFMGSGMLPAGAYVTLEHEYILIFRKGGKRTFITETEKENRQHSALFWEERNAWFSDTWDLKGVRQSMKKADLRDRNAAFPFDLAYRLINMYSVKGDRVLDPFLGTGTTTHAAIVAQRNSIGIEVDDRFTPLIKDSLENCIALSAELVQTRLENHRRFIQSRLAEGKKAKHINGYHAFPVVTKQETQLRLNRVTVILCEDLDQIEVDYDPDLKTVPTDAPAKRKKKVSQMVLFK